MANVSLKLYFIYRSVTVFLIIRYVLFWDRESLLGNCRENVTQGSYLISEQFKSTYTNRNIETFCRSSLEH